MNLKANVLKQLADNQQILLTFKYNNIPIYSNTFRQYCQTLRRKVWKEYLTFEVGDYVLTSNNKIYKVMLKGDTPTQSEPNLISTSIFETKDGYKWEFVALCESDNIVDFLTPQTMPLPVYDSYKPNVNVQTISYLQMDKGCLLKVDVEAGGKGYDKNAKVEVVGDGRGCQVELVLNEYNGSIEGVKILNAGVGYSTMQFNITPNTYTNPASLKPIISPLMQTKADFFEVLCKIQPNTIPNNFIYNSIEVQRLSTPSPYPQFKQTLILQLETTSNFHFGENIVCGNNKAIVLSTYNNIIEVAKDSVFKVGDVIQGMLNAYSNKIIKIQQCNYTPKVEEVLKSITLEDRHFISKQLNSYRIRHKLKE